MTSCTQRCSPSPAASSAGWIPSTSGSVRRPHDARIRPACAEIVTQTSLLIGHLDGADLTVPVPTCPGWTVSQLARHIDGGQRWARDIVATRASEPPSDVALRDPSVATDEDPEKLSASLTEAAAALTATLAEAGPDAQMWC